MIAVVPAVKAPQIEGIGAEVVVDDVEDNRDTVLMAFLDERLERPRPAVGRLHGEEAGRVVTPGAAPLEFGDRHDLDGVNPQLDQVVQSRGDRGEGARPVAPVGWDVKGAHMHLVDHQLVPRGHPKVVPFPVEVRVVDDRVAVSVGDLAGVGVDAPEFAC